MKFRFSATRQLLHVRFLVRNLLYVLKLVAHSHALMWMGLALLSGGERSLTAIALVFALLKVSPTPVCVMDEVDAMLDEANVGRFRDLLIDLSKDTQFIVITHNRNTVQAADVIYGVTMGRDSASKIISLRLDQVTDDMLKSSK